MDRTWKSYAIELSGRFELPIQIADLESKCRAHLTGKQLTIEAATDACITETLAEVDAAGEYDNPAESGRKMALAKRPFVGIGLELGAGKRPGDPLLVVAAIAGGPADRAGVKARDEILEVDGKDVVPLTLNDTITALRGPVGSSARLLLRRYGQTMVLTAAREEIRVNYTRVRALNDSVVYSRISLFRKELTSEQLYRNLANLLRDREPRALIIDLRNNPGGALDEVIAVASLFVPPSTRVLANASRDAQEFLETRAEVPSVLSRDPRLDAALRTVPLLVLVNGRTESGAEALAIILKEHRGAQIVGADTAGSNSLQRRIPLANGGAITITTGRMLSVSGQGWRDRGVPIDVRAPDTFGHELGSLPGDAALGAALQRVRGG